MVAEHVPAQTTGASPRHLRRAALIATAALLVIGTGIALGPTAGAVSAIVAVLLVVPAVIRTRDGRSWWSAIGARTGFRLAYARGWTQYRADDPTRPAPPGLLGASRLITRDGHAVLADAAEPRFHSVVIGVQPVGDPSPDSIRLERTRWTDWLTDLATRERLVGASVTLQVRRGTSRDLQETLAELTGPDTADLARQVLADAVAAMPTAPPQFDAWVSITWDVRGMPSDAALEMIDDSLPELLSGLASSGGQQPRPFTAAELSSLVRQSFTPGRTEDCAWDAAGPTSAHEFSNRYEHGDATSLVWRCTAARDLSTAALTSLLGEDPSVPLKRATLLLRPTGDPTEPADLAMLFTATCDSTDPETLARAARAVRADAARARVDLQPAAGAMASSFAAGLGVGIVPSRMTVLPARLRGLL